MKPAAWIMAATAMLCIALTDPAAARGSRHYTYQGGHYEGGQGSSHKGGHYRNPRTNDHYTRHTADWPVRRRAMA